MTKREQWIKLADEYQASGRTMREFAASHGVKASSLKWWLWQLRQVKETAGVVSNAARRSSSAGAMTFVEVPAASQEPGVMDVVLTSGVRIVLGADFEREALHRLLDVLGGRS